MSSLKMWISSVPSIRALSTLSTIASSIVLGYPIYSIAQDDFFNKIDLDLENIANSSTPVGFSSIAWVSEKIVFGIEEPDSLFSRDERGPAKIESSLFLQTEWKHDSGLSFRFSGRIFRDTVYSFVGRSHYSVAEINEFETRYEVKDLYVESPVSDVHFKAGHQIVAWGVSENLRVSDLVNTQELYTFGQQDIQDLRLQVPAVLSTFSVANWSIDSVITYKAGRNELAPAYDEFDSFIRLRDAGVQLLRLDPVNEIEYFVRASTHFTGGDVSFVVADVNANELSVKKVEFNPTGIQRLIMNQDRFTAIAVSGSLATGSWLYFGEAGIHFNKSIQSENLTFTPDGWQERDQVLAVLGAEYNGFSDTVLTIELDSIHTRNHDGQFAVQRNQLSYNARVLWNGFNDRVQLLGVVSELANDGGRFFRLSVDYDWSDRLELGFMWANYSSKKNSPFYDFRNNDVLQVQFTYSFQW